MRRLGVFGVLVTLLVVGCTAREEAFSVSPAAAGRTRLDARHTLGPAVTVANLTVWPVFADDPLEVGEFLTLREAMDDGLAEVREKGAAPGGQTARQVPPGQRDPRDPQAPPPPNQVPPGQRDPRDSQVVGQVVMGGGATVNTLVIENRSDLPILICAGTVVKGGQQDRQIPQDVIVAARTTIDVEAFCVEQGRWTSMRMGRATGQQFDIAVAQAAKIVRTKGQYEAAQGAVWEEVAKIKERFSAKAAMEISRNESLNLEAMENLRAHENSSSLAVAQDAATELSGKELDDAAEEVRAHFTSFGEGADAPVGFAYAVDGVAEGARMFAHPRIFAKQFDSFLRSICLEAYLARDGKERGEAPGTARVEDVVALVREARAAREELKETAGANANGLYRGDGGFGSRCYLRLAGSGEPDRKLVITEDWTRK